MFYSHIIFLTKLSFPLIKFVWAFLLHPLFQPLYFCCETCLPAPLAFAVGERHSDIYVILTCRLHIWVLPSRLIYVFSYYRENKHSRRSSLGLNMDFLGVEVWSPRFPAAGSWNWTWIFISGTRQPPNKLSELMQTLTSANYLQEWVGRV